MQSFTADDLIVCTYAGCDAPTRLAFEHWIGSLTPALDQEEGSGPEGALAWLKEQNAAFEPHSIHVTFIFKDKESVQIVGTSSIGPDDRVIVKTFNLQSDGVFGLLNVHRNYRNRRVASIITRYREKYIQQFVNQRQQAMRFHFFTSEPIVEKLAGRLGFHCMQTIYVEAFQAHKLLFE